PLDRGGARGLPRARACAGLPRLRCVRCGARARRADGRDRRSLGRVLRLGARRCRAPSDTSARASCGSGAVSVAFSAMTTDLRRVLVAAAIGLLLLALVLY